MCWPCRCYVSDDGSARLFLDLNSIKAIRSTTHVKIVQVSTVILTILDSVVRMKVSFFIASLILLCRLNLISAEILGRLRKISAHLENKVKSEDVGSNLAEARSLLMLKLDRSNSVFRRKSSSSTITALKSLVALEKVLADTTLCHQDNHEVLVSASSLFTGNELDRDPGAKEGLGRFERIVQAAALEHARRCLPRYQAIFETKYSSMDMELVSKVSHLFSKAVHHKLIKNIGVQKHPATIIIEPRDVFLRREGARILYWTLIQLGNYDDINIDAIRCVNGIPGRRGCDPLIVEDVKRLLIEHLIQPCEYFVDELGGIFLTAEFDLRASQDLKIGDRPFNLAFTQFMLCQNLLSSDHSQVFKELVDLVELQKQLDNR